MPTKDHISKGYRASEIKEEIETESEQTYEPILNVGDENIEESERSEQFMIEALEDEGEDIVYRKTMQPQRIYTTLMCLLMCLTEIQLDELDAEFTEAIQ